MADWQEGCERCKQILRYGGMGHTMSIHSTNDQIILEFGLKKPAFRICVNTPTTHGSIGLSTGLDPAMTLGCGGFGGNITSDNITPRHLINIKRVAYELRASQFGFNGPASSQPAARLPQAPEPEREAGLSASAVIAARRVCPRRRNPLERDWESISCSVCVRGRRASGSGFGADHSHR